MWFIDFKNEYAFSGNEIMNKLFNILGVWMFMTIFHIMSYFIRIYTYRRRNNINSIDAILYKSGYIKFPIFCVCYIHLFYYFIFVNVKYYLKCVTSKMFYSIFSELIQK